MISFLCLRGSRNLFGGPFPFVFFCFFLFVFVFVLTHLTRTNNNYAGRTCTGCIGSGCYSAGSGAVCRWSIHSRRCSCTRLCRVDSGGSATATTDADAAAAGPCSRSRRRCRRSCLSLAGCGSGRRHHQSRMGRAETTEQVIPAATAATALRSDWSAGSGWMDALRRGE